MSVLRRYHVGIASVFVSAKGGVKGPRGERVLDAAARGRGLSI